jgi:flagellar biosynthetic protein FliR
MTPFSTEVLAWLNGLLPVIARAAGFAALAPTFDSGNGGLKLRAAVAVLLTLLLAPGAVAPAGISGADAAIALLAQLATGLVCAFALRVMVMAITLATGLIEQQMGFAHGGDSEDGADAAAPSRLYQLAAIALFLTLGGHRLLIAGLLDAPAIELSHLNANDLLEHVLAPLAQACWLALRVAGPLVLALACVNTAAGLIARVLPQFTGVAPALPVQIALGLVLMLLSLPGVSHVWSEAVQAAVSFVHFEPPAPQGKAG